MKNVFIVFCMIMASVSVVAANSTIYTDDIGRMHFLGKDPGSSTLSPVADYSNPQQKDLTDVIYKNSGSSNESDTSTTESSTEKKEIFLE